MSFPGMIHFLFIDRSFDELTSPSLSTDGQVVGAGGVQIIATALGVEWFTSSLSRQYLMSRRWRDGKGKPQLSS